MSSTRFIATTILFTAIALCFSHAALFAQAPSLVELLTERLGVTETQAQGGAGAIFNLAKEKLGARDFSQVAGVVPDMNGLLGAAPKKESPLGGLFGGATSILGGGEGRLEGLAGLAGSFSQLGLSPEMVKQFMPIILNYVKANGGETMSNLLAAVLP